jgi:hypothetical protein
MTDFHKQTGVTPSEPIDLDRKPFGNGICLIIKTYTKYFLLRAFFYAK